MSRHDCCASLSTYVVVGYMLGHIWAYCLPTSWRRFEVVLYDWGFGVCGVPTTQYHMIGSEQLIADEEAG